MRKFYQTEWHGIPFTSFTRPSMQKLADSDFYSLFYSAFFKKYKTVNDLAPEWINLKESAAAFIGTKINKQQSVLSIGCGLGIIELYLLRKGYSNLDITEVSATPLAWLKPLLPEEQVFIGHFPRCLPQGKKYDVILLASIEYFFKQKEMLYMLEECKALLKENGRCILLSWSFDFVKKSLKYRIIYALKCLLKATVCRFSRRAPFQFWGYIRERSEFLALFRKAGFNQVQDGMLTDNPRWNTYWIEGKK